MQMRVLLAATCLALAACASGEGPPPEPARPQPPAVLAAVDMRPTLYDDGLACPGGCDAHVVFHRDHNGTANAYAPGSTRAAPAACVSGQPCVICFGAPTETCMTALFRGAGPARGRFDMTPALFEARCGETGAPAAFAAECRRLSDAAARLGYDRRVNCLARPTEPRCALLLGPKRAAQRSDAVERDKCLAAGEDAYNRQQADPLLKRTLGCNYYLNQKGSNAAGETWFKLAPGACRPNTYVGRDGLDCCSASVFAAAAFHPECRGYFLDPL